MALAMSEAITRLSRVLGMMGSDHDGEALNAARLAEKIRRDMNKSWVTLLTGTSDNTSSTEYMLRAMRAETRALAAERRANELESRITRLEAELAGLRAGQGGPSYRTTSTRRGSRYDTNLTPEQERILVHGLTQFARSANWVHAVTGWERPMNLKVRLPRIAAKHGLRMETPLRGHYCFYPLRDTAS